MHDLSTLKVCFLAGTLGHGGAERQLFYALRVLAGAGALVRLLCLNRDEFWEEPIRNLGVRVTWVGRQPSRLCRLVRILREVRKERPEVLQSQHFYVNAYVGAAATLFQLSGIGAMRSNGRFEMGGVGRAAAWASLHWPRMVAANSQAAIQYALAQGVPPARLFFLSNVVDTEQFKPREQPTDAPLTLLSVGRIAAEKRLDRFITVLARLRALPGPEVKGLIVGPAHGPAGQALRAQLESQARSLGLLPDHLQFLGGISNLAPLYQQAAVAVLTSDLEGTPNVLLEAMASGLPVVAASVGGVPEIVRHGQSGFLAAPDDLGAFVRSLTALARSPALRRKMGCQARVDIEANHSLEALSAQLQTLYALALPNRPRPESSPRERPLRA